MAALRGTVTGNRGPASRLGSPRSGLRTLAATWSTFAHVYMDANGAGSFTLEDDSGRTIARVTWRAEDQADRVITFERNNRHVITTHGG